MIKKAYLAGGCFWGMEELFRSQTGVVDVEAGYTGGEKQNPTWFNHAGHAEAIEVSYDDQQTSFLKLLDFFFRVHNPTTKNQQGNDIGSGYRSAIFYQNRSELDDAMNMIEIVNQSGLWDTPVVTTLEPFTKFWLAESYHQDYLQYNKGGYTCHFIRRNETFL